MFWWIKSDQGQPGGQPTCSNLRMIGLTSFLRTPTRKNLLRPGGKPPLKNTSIIWRVNLLIAPLFICNKMNRFIFSQFLFFFLFAKGNLFSKVKARSVLMKLRYKLINCFVSIQKLPREDESVGGKQWRL